MAKGCLHSIDPNAQVGGQALGDNWCQVHVQVVLQPEEQLIRPYDYCQTLEDAHGGMVAWPGTLVCFTFFSKACFNNRTLIYTFLFFSLRHALIIELLYICFIFRWHLRNHVEKFRACIEVEAS